MYKYIYCGGFFKDENGAIYDLEVPTPHLHKTPDDAEKDTTVFRFRKTDKGVVLTAYPDENFKRSTDKYGRPCLAINVAGKPLADYSYEAFKKLPGSRLLRMKEPSELRSGFFCNGDFVPVDISFDELFSNLEEGRLIFIDNESFYVAEESELS